MSLGCKTCGQSTDGSAYCNICGSPPEESTVLERIQRIRNIASNRDLSRPEACFELEQGLGNLHRELRECVDDDTPDCTHCGSPFTFTRTDGDTGCVDCSGIMPNKNAVGQAESTT